MVSWTTGSRRRTILHIEIINQGINIRGMSTPSIESTILLAKSKRKSISSLEACRRRWKGIVWFKIPSIVSINIWRSTGWMMPSIAWMIHFRYSPTISTSYIFWASAISSILPMSKPSISLKICWGKNQEKTYIYCFLFAIKKHKDTKRQNRSYTSFYLAAKMYNEIPQILWGLYLSRKTLLEAEGIQRGLTGLRKGYSNWSA